MTNGSDSAFPKVASDSCSAHDNGSYDGERVSDVYSTGGLTKREYFAAMAMQGILARVSWHADMISNESVKQADALIAELAKNEVGQ